MLHLDFAFFAVAVPAVIFAGISKGGFGSGGAFVSSAILAILLDPGVALALMLSKTEFQASTVLTITGVKLIWDALT